MKKTLIILTASIVIISNIPIFAFLWQENYTYANADQSFEYKEEPNKGKTYWGCQRLYGYFLCQHPDKDQGDNRLYRTFTVKPWRFWEWREMIFHNERFALPYLEAKK